MAKKLINRLDRTASPGSKVSEQDLLNYSVGAFLTDEENRTLWVNGMPYGNAYISDNARQPKHAEIFNDFDHNKAEGHYSHAEGGAYVNTVYNNAKITYVETDNGYKYSVPYTSVLNKMIQVMRNKDMNIPLYVAVNNEERLDTKNYVENDNRIADNEPNTPDEIDIKSTVFVNTPEVKSNKSTETKYYIIDSTVTGNIIYFNVATSNDPNAEPEELPDYCNGKTMYFHYYYAYDGKDGWSEATKDGAHAEGISQAHGVMSHAEGFANRSYEDYSHTEGVGNEVYGLAAHAEGDRNIVTNSAPYSHTEGHMNIAKADSVHVEGRNNLGNNTGAHVEGGRNVVNGIYGHAEGYGNTVNNDYAHTEGQRTEVNGIAGHAEGFGNKVNNNYGHAEGQNTVANGIGAHTEGIGTITANNAEHAEGMYNVSENGYISSIGIGSDDSTRKNAITVLSDGRVYLTKTEEVIKDIRNIYDPCNYSGLNLTESSKTIQQVLTETTDKMINIRYANLVKLRDNSLLIPGQYYRITDFATSLKSTLQDIKSAGNKFDIVVLAGSKTELFEQCYLLLPDVNVNNFKINAENNGFTGSNKEVNTYTIENNVYKQKGTVILDTYQTNIISSLNYKFDGETIESYRNTPNITIRTETNDVYVFDIFNVKRQTESCNNVIDKFNKKRFVKITEYSNVAVSGVNVSIIFGEFEQSNGATTYYECFATYKPEDGSELLKPTLTSINKYKKQTGSAYYIQSTVGANSTLWNYFVDILSDDPIFVIPNNTSDQLSFNTNSYTIVSNKSNFTVNNTRNFYKLSYDVPISAKFGTVGRKLNLSTKVISVATENGDTITNATVNIDNENTSYIFIDNVDIINGLPTILTTNYYNEQLKLYKDTSSDNGALSINLFGYTVGYSLDNYKYSDFVYTEFSNEFTSYDSKLTKNDSDNILNTLSYYTIGDLYKQTITSNSNPKYWPLYKFNVLEDTENFTKYNYRWNQVNIFSTDSSDIEQQNNEQDNNYCILTTAKEIYETDHNFKAALCIQEYLESIVYKNEEDSGIVKLNYLTDDIYSYNNIKIENIAFKNGNTNYLNTLTRIKNGLEYWQEQRNTYNIWAVTDLLDNSSVIANNCYFILKEFETDTNQKNYFPILYYTKDKKVDKTKKYQSSNNVVLAWSTNQEYINSIKLDNIVYNVRLGDNNEPEKFTGILDGDDYVDYQIYEYVCVRVKDSSEKFTTNEEFEIFDNDYDKSINTIIEELDASNKQWSYGSSYVLVKQTNNSINVVDGFYDMYLVYRDMPFTTKTGYNYSSNSSNTETIYHIDSNIEDNLYYFDFSFIMYNKDYVKDDTNTKYSLSAETFTANRQLGGAIVNYDDIKNYNYVYYQGDEYFAYFTENVENHCISFKKSDDETQGIAIYLTSKTNNDDSIFTTSFNLFDSVSKYYFIEKIKDIEEPTKTLEYHLPFYFSRGFIYKMEDDQNNTATYDFLNVQFYHNNSWHYTFDNNGQYGLRNNKTIKNNEIKSSLQIPKNIISTNDSIIQNNSICNSSVICSPGISLINNMFKDSENVSITKDVVNSTFVNFNNKQILKNTKNACIYNSLDFEYTDETHIPTFSIANFRVYDNYVDENVELNGDNMSMSNGSILSDYNSTEAKIELTNVSNALINNCTTTHFQDYTKARDNFDLKVVTASNNKPKPDILINISVSENKEGLYSENGTFDLGYVYTGCKASIKTKWGQNNAPELKVWFKSTVNYKLATFTVTNGMPSFTNSTTITITKDIKTDYIHKDNCWSQGSWSSFGCNIVTHLGLKVGEDSITLHNETIEGITPITYNVGNTPYNVGLKVGNKYILYVSSIYYVVTEYRMFANSTGNYKCVGDGYFSNIGYQNANPKAKEIPLNTNDMVISKNTDIFEPSETTNNKVNYDLAKFTSSGDNATFVIVDSKGIFNKKSKNSVSLFSNDGVFIHTSNN